MVERCVRIIPEGDRQGVGDGEWRVKIMRDSQVQDQSGGERSKKEMGEITG
jgi:hypothetical protein